MATFMSWAAQLNKDGPLPSQIPPNVLAAAGACVVTRKAAAMAFSKHKRSMRAMCLIDELGFVMDNLSG